MLGVKIELLLFLASPWSATTHDADLLSAYERADEASIEFPGLRDGMPAAVQRGDNCVNKQ